MPRGSRARPPDRAATETALERAALALLERNGVLAGLNLREVADEAGVNRGLVYHYFGSRRDLLRAALGADVRERLRELREASGRPMRQRYLNFFRTMLHHRRAVVLSALLVLDGDTRLRFDPGQENRRRRFEAEIARGEMPAGFDGDGHWAAISSLVYGYAIFRSRFADELGVDLEELDGRVMAVVDGFLADVERRAPSPARADADSPARAGVEDDPAPA